MDFDTVQRVGKAMVSSGYFSDAREVAQAIVKIMAGQEMGLGAFSSMTGIHVIKGKPVLGANLIATLIKNDPRYDYRVTQLDDAGCMIDFYENGKVVGSSSFSQNDAQAANLAGDNWRKFPRNMYFARAISNGAKWYTPGVFGGAPVYTPDEIGATVDEDGDVVEGEAVTVSDNGQEPPRPPERVVEINDELGLADKPAGDTTRPQDDELVDSQEDNGPTDEVDHFTAALEAADLKAFAEHAYQALDGYDSVYNVVGAMTEKWPEAHEQKSFRFTASKTDAYLQWLADRKAVPEAAKEGSDG
jgi:hypothetical protein